MESEFNSSHSLPYISYNVQPISCKHKSRKPYLYDQQFIEACSASWDQEHPKHVCPSFLIFRIAYNLERKRKLIDLLTRY